MEACKLIFCDQLDELHQRRVHRMLCAFSANVDRLNLVGRIAMRVMMLDCICVKWQREAITP